MAWREPLAEDWRAQIAEIVAEVQLGCVSPASAGRLRRLACMRLGHGERLRLRRLAQACVGLPAPPPGFRKARLLLVSNRTMAFYASDLEASALARGLLLETVDIPYDGVMSVALCEDSGFADASFDAVLLLVDLGFLQAPNALMDVAAEREHMVSAASRLDAAIHGLRGRFDAPVIVATFAPTAEIQLTSADTAVAGTAIRAVESANRHLVGLAERGEVVLFDLAAVANRIGSLEFFDPVRHYEAKVPFSFEASPVAADALTAVLAAMLGRSARALVVDLDNTLWGGVVGDDGVEGIVIGQGSAAGEAFAAVQRFALDLRQRGVVLAACTKNFEEVARGPFRSHPDMLIGEGDFAAFVANFDDKATNVARVAELLNLDPSSLVLLDDNPAERERVRSALPWVMAPEVGEEPAHFVRTVIASGFFEHLRLTADDLGRAAAYEARSQAKTLQATIGDYDAYLRSLEMRLSLAPFDEIGRARVMQLVQKSNQFNPTTIRYSEREIAEFEADPSRLAWQIRLRDRFADHGMISALVVSRGEAAWAIESWVMSCRVLARGVEAAVIRELARCASASGASHILAAYLPTRRNALVAELFDRLGFERTDVSADGAISYRLELATARLEPQPMEVTFVGSVASSAEHP